MDLLLKAISQIDINDKTNEYAAFLLWYDAQMALKKMAELTMYLSNVKMKVNS